MSIKYLLRIIVMFFSAIFAFFVPHEIELWPDKLVLGAALLFGIYQVMGWLLGLTISSGMTGVLGPGDSKGLRLVWFLFGVVFFYFGISGLLGIAPF